MSDSASEADRASDQAETTNDTAIYQIEKGDYVVLARRWKHGEQTGITIDAVYKRIAEGRPDFPDVRSENLARMLVNGEMKLLSSPSSAEQSQSSEPVPTT